MRMLEAGAPLGESPAWHRAEHVLYRVDVFGRRINRSDPKTGETLALALPESAHPVALTRSG